MVDDAELIRRAMDSPDAFAESLQTYLREQGWTAVEFSEETGVPQSTVYSLLSGDRDFRVSTLRKIVEFVRQRNSPDEEFIAVITSRSVLDRLTRRELQLCGRELTLRDYPAISIEEVIVEAVKAERHGAAGIVCGPIAATTIQEFVKIPVAAIRLDDHGVGYALETLENRLESDRPRKT